MSTSTDTGFFGHPRGLAVLFFTEMWERFGYYGMRALLILYLTAGIADGGLAYDASAAGSITGCVRQWKVSSPGVCPRSFFGNAEGVCHHLASRTSAAATARVRAMWEAAGAQVSEMDSVHHDAVLAATSHLPHVLAYTLVNCLAKLDDRDEVFEYAAGGFLDFTRIASSDPVMWRDICVANGDAIELLIEHFIGDLQSVKAAAAT